MKIAHSAVVTPHRAGLYETTRDLAGGLRKLGIDSRIVDPIRDRKPGSDPSTSSGCEEDRGVPIASWDFAEEADIIASHSGLGKAFANTSKPVMHMLHGRPYSSFLIEQGGDIPVLTYLQKVRSDRRFRAFITFWPEFLDYWSLFLPDERLFVIKAPVDLERWNPKGPNGYQFHGNLGRINIVCTDVWRRDKDPYHVVMAYNVYARNNPGAQLHIYAAPDDQLGTGWPLVKKLLGDSLGEVCGFVQGLENVYRAADVMITPHRIATRSVREALACGCSVVMAPGNIYTEFVADPEDLMYFATMISLAVSEGDRDKNRMKAETCFSADKAALEFLEVVERVI